MNANKYNFYLHLKLIPQNRPCGIFTNRSIELAGWVSYAENKKCETKRPACYAQGFRSSDTG